MQSTSRLWDVVGIGFGPSNLALAVALDEAGTDLAALFCERQRRFGWHPDMLLDGATIQVSFLKDLVTMRNPASQYSFLSYLHAQDRLADFVNHKILFPSRIEFNDYLVWVASQFSHLVDYDSEVVGVHPVPSNGSIASMEVMTRTGGPSGPVQVHTARNIVVATGLHPVLPVGVEPTGRISHSDRLLSSVQALAGQPVRRAVVVGAGQSAAETVDYLHRRFAEAEVCAVLSRFGYSPADDSSFANRVFDPAAVDTFFRADEGVKQMVFDYHRNTNYSVVDPALIEELYRRNYQEKVCGRQRLRILNLSRVASVEETATGVCVVVESLTSGDREALEADLIVYATGYREADVLDLLGEMGKYCLRDKMDRPRVRRDYRLETADGVECGIYLQGATEHTHGISSSLLSNIAVRSAEIVRSIADRTPRDRSQVNLHKRLTKS